MNGYVSKTPWEDAHRASTPDTDESSAALALCRMYDRTGVPVVTPIPGHAPRSAFLRAMYSAQQRP